MDKIGQYGQLDKIDHITYSDSFAQYGHYWTIQIFLMDKIGQFEQL